MGLLWHGRSYTHAVEEQPRRAQRCSVCCSGMLLADCALLAHSSHCDACSLLVAPLFSAVWLKCTLALGQDCLLGSRLHADLFHTKLACLLSSTHGI
jgi:hypothetical protein